MKKYICFILFAVFLAVFLFGCKNGGGNELYLRIHIRANNNEKEHQSVKYDVKNEVTKYLTPFLAECQSKKEAYDTVNKELANIQNLCSRVLDEKGFDYGCKAYTANEFFPLRGYNEFTFESGYYDALIIELGEGKGDNWWCMVYPPLCFTEGEYCGGEKIIYKSKILEIIENFKKQYLS